MEMAVFGTQTGSGPAIHSRSHVETARVQVSKLGQGDEGLRDAMDVDRVCAIGAVLRRAVRQEKIASIEVEPARQRALEFRCPTPPRNVV